MMLANNPNKVTGAANCSIHSLNSSLKELRRGMVVVEEDCKC